MEAFIQGYLNSRWGYTQQQVRNHCSRLPSAWDAIDRSISLIISACCLIFYSVGYSQHAVVVRQGKKRMYTMTFKILFIYLFIFLLFSPLKLVLPLFAHYSELTDLMSSAWAYCMQDHPQLEAPPALTSQDVTRAFHTSNILRGGKKKRGKSSLPKLRGLGLKPRGCASTPLQKPPCYIRIRPVIVRTEWQRLRTQLFLCQSSPVTPQ